MREIIVHVFFTDLRTPKVEEIRDKLIAANKKSYWVPAHVQEKRFHNWLRDARDWCISRSRWVGFAFRLSLVHLCSCGFVFLKNEPVYKVKKN